MIRWGLVAALVLPLSAVGGSRPAGNADGRVAVEAEPDVELARPLPDWPTAADLDRLEFVKGKPRGVVLRVMGHPCRVEKRAGGVEVWDYPWQAACRVWLRDGVCTATFSTGGY